MKLIILLSFFTVLQMNASVFSQNGEISVKLNNLAIKDVFDVIENEFGYKFIYSDDLVDANEKVSIDVNKKNIEEVIQLVLSNFDYSYRVLDDKLVVIYPSQSDKQEITVKGNVRDTEGNPLPGVNVVEKGTTNGTITDLEGNFAIQVNSPNTVLSFSYVGYLTEDIEVADQNTINITLIEDIRALEEVVVIGYGTQRKKDLTGSISRVKGDDIILPSTMSFDQMLQGKVAGVQISQTSGAPGGNVNVLVRGVSSITGGNQPLYVIDGYPIGAGGGGANMLSFGSSSYSSSGMANSTQNRINPLASINPSDIESIEILKDASATAIYGSRGANGVVIITTKRGSTGKSQINVDVSYGVQEVAHKLEMLNAQQYAEYVAEGRDNAWVYSGGSASDPNEVRTASTRVRPEFRNPESITTNTDWQDVIFRIAPVQNYQVSTNGGNDKTKYFLSGGVF